MTRRRRRLRAPCAEPGCPTLTYDSRCPTHRRDRSRDPRWAAFRAAVLAGEPLCRHCGAVAVEVDHITPIADGGAELDPQNAQPLCKACHAAKTALEA